MFLRVVRANVSKDVKREYVRVVEAYRDHDGKTQHRTVINLGRRDLLATHLDLDKLGRLLHGEAVDDGRVGRDDVGAIGAWDWGPMLAARAMWSELGLEAMLDQLARPDRREAVRLSDRALVLVANRLTAPGSEHALAQWLENDFVCDRRGRRFVAAWRDDVERKASRTPRVRVEAHQLQQWYRTLDQLLACKAQVEHALFLRLRDLFSLRVDMVFYDLTSTYFEGQGPPTLGANGHSRDGKPRNRQILVGLVMVDGWPIAHHVFAGNRRDANTVPDVLRDLEQRFGLKRVVFVGDRGMVTSQNLDDLRGGGHGYIVGRNRRRSGEVFDYIQSATGPWIECRAGVTTRERANAPKTLVQEVAASQPGVRVFVVHSEERAGFETAQRVKAMERVRIKLEALQRRVVKGRLKAAAKIGAAAARILAGNHGHRYYDWAYEDSAFRFFEHPVHFPREQAYEGKYVIQTEEPNLSAVDAVRLYKELSDVERAFASLKDIIDMRPIYHRTDGRAQAHIFVAALAFLLHRAIEKKLKAARLDLSAAEALTALKSVRLVDIALGDGTTKRSVTHGSQRAATVLRAPGLIELDPPTPPQ
jgi:transposase